MNDSRDSMRDHDFVCRLIEELEAGRPVALCTVLATRGSMPRGAGARMAAFADGGFMGTVGGGRVEQMALDRALALATGRGEPFLEWFTMQSTGMACGGDALIACDLLDQGDLDALRRTLELNGQGRPGVYCESWPEGGHRVEALTLDELASDDPRASLEAPTWDEAGRSYAEPLGSDPIVYVFGAGHVAHALVPVLTSVGFRAVVYDDRPELAVAERFPTADRVLCGDFRSLGDQVEVSRRDYVVVATHGHAADIDVLERVAPAEPAYTGCLGSARKSAFAKGVLAKHGIAQSWIDSLCMPIGDDILAVTPGEIAISITGEMIRRRAELRPHRPHEH